MAVGETKLETLLARDLMQTEVITLPENASIREAVQTFEECGIKGAPVVDITGKPIGVITSSDVARTGHLEGDRVLRTVAQALQSVIRASDDVGRYGGEEFLLVFPETDIDAAAVLSEKLRSTVEELALTTDDGTSIEIRVSIGMAALPGIGKAGDAKGCIAEADRELYRAKAAGRNRVEPQRGQVLA